MDAGTRQYVNIIERTFFERRKEEYVYRIQGQIGHSLCEQTLPRTVLSQTDENNQERLIMQSGRFPDLSMVIVLFMVVKKILEFLKCYNTQLLFLLIRGVAEK